MPVLGRSLDVEAAVVRAAGSAVDAAAAAARGAADLPTAGGTDPARLRALAQDLDRRSAAARTDLRALGALPLRGTPTAVARAVADARAALAPAVSDLRDAAAGAQLAAALLGADRPRPLLVALQNNAELQGAGGYASSVALGTAAGGRVALDPFQDVVAVNDPPEEAVRVPAPPEFREDYGPFLADTTLWRTWTMSPDVPDVASVGSRVAGRLLGTAPEVVVLLDVPALAALADLSGGVVLDGRRLAGEELEQALLVDAYADAGARVEDQEARRAALQAAAGGALQDLLGGGVSPGALLPVLGDLAAGRHLSIWSAVPREQRVLRRLGLAGELGVGCADLLSVNVNNLNANKLDAYATRQVAYEAEVGARSTQVVQRVRLRQDAPADVVPYVAGALTPGVALERVELSAGPAARAVSLTVDGRTAQGSVRRSADRTRVATTVRLPRGREVLLELRYELPRDGSDARLELVPQPLADDAVLSVRLRPAPGLLLQPAQVPEGAVVQGTSVIWSGPFSRSAVVEVRPVRPAPPPGPLERLRSWWDTPLGASRARD